MSETLRTRKIWKFGDNIDTDLMMPSDVLWAGQEQRMRAVFRANRPGWAGAVAPGDAIVAGHNFGMGSSRPAALSLRLCGVGFIVCETMNGLFFRNAVNYGLPAFECPGVTNAFEEGHAAEISIDDWTIMNLQTGTSLSLIAVPEMLFALMRDGGLFPYMERQGLIDLPNEESAHPMPET